MIRRRAWDWMGLIGLLVGLAGATSAGAGPRDATLEQLRGLSNGVESESVRVIVNEGGGAPLRIGDSLRYRFESTKPGYLTAIHVDTHGSTTLLYPRAKAEEGLIAPDSPIVLPSAEDGFELEVQPPVGLDFVYAFVTDEPLARKDFGVSSYDLVVSFEPHQAPAFVRRLKEALLSRATGHYRAAHAAQQIDGRGDVQYVSNDIVTFFNERTRSIRPAKLDLQIQFATNSAALDEAAQRNVDEFARALVDPKLAGMRFKVAGHTDDRGSEEHNLKLSEQRAETVRDFLVQERGIDAGRLEIEAHGESNPLMEEETSFARSMNRRVEFMPIR